MYSELPSKEELEKECKKIFSFVEKSKKGEIGDLKGALEKNEHFFSMLQVVLDKGSEEEKKEAGRVFKEVFVFFAEEIKKNQNS